MFSTGWHATAFSFHPAEEPPHVFGKTQRRRRKPVDKRPTFQLTVHRDSDGHEFFGDAVRATNAAEVPEAARIRLEAAGWLVQGEWWEFPGLYGTVWLVPVITAPRKPSPPDALKGWTY